MAKKAGILLRDFDFATKRKDEHIINILIQANKWFVNNLKNPESKICRDYLLSRKLNQSSIDKYSLGYSYNANITLYEHLIKLSFKESDIINSNVVKVDKSHKIKDYFYKRLIFPIFDERKKIVGFGGRSLDDRNPKYINSPESNFFKKRNLLYNLNEAKLTARKKNNLLICEGYMDVISLNQNGIESVVSPLGTALTSEQLFLAWKYVKKPTIMFDGDMAGVRAAYKTSLLALTIMKSENLLQFIILPNNYDPDKYINSYSFDQLINLLKNPLPIIDFIFGQVVLAFPLKSADDKIRFDKYLDDLIETIKDKKIKYFYKNELKSLFFNELRLNKNTSRVTKKELSNINTSLYETQLLSFIATYINHLPIRSEIEKEIINSNLFDKNHLNLLKELSKPYIRDFVGKEVIDKIVDKSFSKIIKESLKSKIYQLFPYSSPKYDALHALEEIKESCLNLNTRLLNLKKINKSLISFIDDSNQLNWDELQKISKELNYEK